MTSFLSTSLQILLCSTDIREVLLRLSREMVELFGLSWDEEGLEEYQAVKVR